MQRVLITGMSGTGKSAVIDELARRGYKAIDTDYGGWHEWVVTDGERDWVWREDLLQQLLSTQDAEVLFIAGTSTNQKQFYPQFDHVILLTAPTPLILDRLATRANNPYGRHPEELADVLRYIETVEPRMRRSATAVIDTTAPLKDVVSTILRLIGEE